MVIGKTYVVQKIIPFAMREYGALPTKSVTIENVHAVVFQDGCVMFLTNLPYTTDIEGAVSTDGLIAMFAKNTWESVEEKR